MRYSTPELLLVGAASGIVLGGAAGVKVYPDNLIGRCDPEFSRDQDCQ